MAIDLYALHAFRTANLGGNDAIGAKVFQEVFMG